MKRHFKSTIITSLIFAIIIFIININYYRIIYLKDSINSYLLNTFETKIPDRNNYTTINPDLCRNFKKPYKNLPKGFIHTGSFLFFRSEKPITVKKIALKSIKYTNFYRTIDLVNAIKKYNAIEQNIIQTNQILLIPGSLQPLIPDIKKNNKLQLIYSRGLYYTGKSTGSIEMLKWIPEYNSLGINTIVFDAKNIEGIVTYFSNIKMAQAYNTHKKRSIDNIEMLLRELKKNNIYTIARIAVFRDHLLVKKAPSLAIKSGRSGKVWNAGSKELWCDPTNQIVQDYNISLAVELADMGVDEIQFDYIRFPTVGNLRDAKYSFDFGKMSKEQTISQFLRKAYQKISSRNTFLSIDIFGVVAWNKTVDIKKTGQKIELLAGNCDVISPMLYPSHFNDNFDGFTNPADHPYHFINKGSKKVIKLAKNKVAVRPWLQAFKLRTSNYNEKYILDQIRASEDSGAYGYLFWNSSNRYNMVYKALKKMYN